MSFPVRKFALAAALIFSAAPAFAQSNPNRAAVADVTVSVSPELREKADEYGAKEIEGLAADLEADVEKALARKGRLSGAADTGADRLELVLVDAVPNRPTLEQLKDKPGLSMASLSIGGAEIQGRLVHADGSSTPVAYKWYDRNLADVVGAGVWSTAQTAFDRFADKVSKGDL
ncbi:hypothetical protein [Caulobacter sp. 17J80-11]|uniref:hypothetical protein n=1 Tax=Caulobacter sp. 17J80-11 TaxID=2763502 RepID=UPI001653A275|nr:hypothetical protein [Caulobacter sp. 17J80-11]MBC6983092.1 hypothetical protein [Caulobacter sp. 17J80-11]